MCFGRTFELAAPQIQVFIYLTYTFDQQSKKIFVSNWMEVCAFGYLVTVNHEGNVTKLCQFQYRHAAPEWGMFMSDYLGIIGRSISLVSMIIIEESSMC